MHVIELEHLMESALSDAVASHHPLDWDENAITHALLIKLRSYFRHKRTIYGARTPMDFGWEIYKLKGTPERDHGDIGVLIQYRMPSGDILEGVGFLEAKIRGLGTTKFPHVRPKQVTRILSRSPQTRLLLYDYNPVAVTDSFRELDFDRGHWHPGWHNLGNLARVTHGPILPLSLAAAVKQYDDSLYRFCHAFSQQFTRRYFNLHDLEFTDTAIQAVKGRPRDVNSPNIIMVIRMVPTGQELPEVFIPDSDFYGAIE